MQRGDGVKRKRGGEPAVAELESRRAVLVYPPGPPPAVLVLKREQRREVAFHAQADGRAGQHAHGEGESIARAPRALKDALTKERRKTSVQGGVTARAAQEARGEEEETLGGLVVPCAVEIGPVGEHAEDPVEGQGELVSASVGVEQAEDVQGDDRVRACSLGVKVRLSERCWISGLRGP